MHARKLAEIGSWVATRSDTLVFGEEPQRKLAASNYWTSSKIRIQNWATSLKMFQRDFEGNALIHDPWPAFSIVVEEIVVSELLTRVWSAVVTTHDWYHNDDEHHGLAHAINVAHVEAKNRAFRLMLANRSANEEAFDKTNRLRRKIESWTDLFLGQLPSTEDAQKFAFEPSRVRDFNLEYRHYENRDAVNRQNVLVASMSQDLRESTGSSPACPTQNRKIGNGIMACFPSDRFDSVGLPKSAKMLNLERNHDDTQKLMDELLAFENQSSTHSIADLKKWTGS